MTNPNTPPTSTPTPTVDDLDEARDLPWSTLDRLIARFEESRTNAARAEQLGELDRRLQPWVELAISEAIEARFALTRGIIATNPGFARLVQNCERFRWPTRAIQSGDRIYLTFADPDREDEPGGYDQPPLMKLVGFEVGSILPFTVQAVTEAMLPGPPPSPAPPVEPDPADDPVLQGIFRENVKLMGADEVIRRMAMVPKLAR